MITTLLLLRARSTSINKISSTALCSLKHLIAPSPFSVDSSKQASFSQKYRSVCWIPGVAGRENKTNSQLLLGSKHLTQQNLKLLAFGTKVQLGNIMTHTGPLTIFHVFSLHMECHVGLHWSKCYSIFAKHKPL